MGMQRYDVTERRLIIERKSLIEAIFGAVQSRSDDETRVILLSHLRDALKAGREEIKARLYSGKISGLQAARSYSYLIDQIIRIVFDVTLAKIYPVGNPTKAERVSIVATGGYGRELMAPFSDIDLMFLVPYKKAPWAENVIEFILYILWDLGLKVGHASRTIDESLRYANKDLTIKTALLDARYIWGDQALFSEFLITYKNKIIKKQGREFAEAKLLERQKRHERMGDSRYVVEPNLKEGKGGLRDLQTIHWISRFVFQLDRVSKLTSFGVMTSDDVQTYYKAKDFFWTVRCYLHLLAGRATEQLTFDVQTQLAESLRYRSHPGLTGVERFMKHYFLFAKQVGELTHIFCTDLEDRHKKSRLFELPSFGRRKKVEGFRLLRGRLVVDHEEDFRKDPVKLLEIFWVADQNELDIHPDTMRLIGASLKYIDSKMRRDPRAGQVFVNILTSKKTPERTLRRLNDSGVFGKFIPDFGRVVAQMQHDMYHHYTVDEHTIRALGLVSDIEKGRLVEDHPIASKVVHKLTSREVLYMAVFLHDIAKGRGGDHSIIGAQIAHKLCPRLGFTPAQTELIAWLVENHLIMSSTAFKRDIADPKTIDDFVNIVKSPERLRLLTVLTVVDIRAVGPNIWNAWKRQLLSDLYHATEERLDAGQERNDQQGRLQFKKETFFNQPIKLSEAEKTYFANSLADSYWYSEDDETIKRNARLVTSAIAKNRRLNIEVVQEVDKELTHITIFARPKAGLFSNIAGALSEIGANIQGAKIHTSNDGWIVDNFIVQDAVGGALQDPEKLQKLFKTVQAWILGKGVRASAVRRRKFTPSRAAVFKVEPFVICDNNASNMHTVIEVNAKDRRGLLYDLTRVFREKDINIISAHIATYGERAVDVFYVQESKGQKITHKGRLKSLQEKLVEATKAS